MKSSVRLLTIFTYFVFALLLCAVGAKSNAASPVVRSGYWIDTQWRIGLALDLTGSRIHGYRYLLNRDLKPAMNAAGEIDVPSEFVGSSSGNKITVDFGPGWSWRGRLTNDGRLDIEERFLSGRSFVAKTYDFQYARALNAQDFPLPSPPTTRSWPAFLARFENAIRERNITKLAALMSNDFGAPNFTRVPNDTIKRDLDTWAQSYDMFGQVRQVLDAGKWTSSTFLGRPQRQIIRMFPCGSPKGSQTSKCAVLLSFRVDYDGQWHWIDLALPGD